MTDRKLLFTLLSTLAYLGIVNAAESKITTPSSIRGLNPALYDRYEPTVAGHWTCLDGSKTISFAAINDDYCDCADGSDEPGTSACSNGSFWCKNDGHTPGTILSSRVNDGLCDPECCDGSDEWATGACPNRCGDIGKAHREKEEAERKTRKTGAKIRSTYIKWAHGEKKRLNDELETKRAQVKDKEVEVKKALEQLEKIEARSKEDLEKKKQSPLYTSLLSHRLALTRLRSKTSALQAELDSLHDILSELAKGYNPNYQDMAVKAAVVGYEESTGAAPKEGDAPESNPEEKEEIITDRELDELEKKDLEALLLLDVGEDTDGDDDDSDEGSLLWKIDEYIPDSLYDSWETVRDLAIEWLVRIGLSGKKSRSPSATSTVDGPHVAAAREKHRNLSNELNKLNNDIRSASETIDKMTLDFGPQAEWKKLDGTCVDKVAGDYTYELCFFGKATQRSNKDSSSNHLGTFTSWNTGADQGSYPYYSKQHYRNGAKCWNGPMRSVAVDLSCGTSNALLSISEPEKCEYRFKVTSPALCWPDQAQPGAAGEKTESDDADAGVKEEL